VLARPATGAHAKMTAGADLRAGISVDQVAAREFGKYTQLASLELGLESSEVVGTCESAYSCAYYNTISWREETSPLPMENRPRAIFEAPVWRYRQTDPAGAPGAAARGIAASPRFRLREEVKQLRGVLGAPDRRKIDQYLEAERDPREVACSWRRTGRPRTAAYRRAGRYPPQAFSEYYKLMTDLMVVALADHMTRVCTFQIGHEMSGRAYPEVGFGDAHHAVTHHQGDPEKIEKTTKINVLPYQDAGLLS